MKRIFVIDWALVPLFILVVYTGIELHVAGHEDNHDIWHSWAVFHVVVSLLFLMVMLFHIIDHRNWYKGILSKKKARKKGRVTICLSVMFILVVVTGLALLGIEGANTPVGLWHYKAGILMGVLSAGHILKRASALRRFLRR